ncbi:histone-like nucleoid-structuring protein Lsr2 [Catellatospora sichuanensis]|uniref:histone-like nucleoid-structuring protein Lsr2 n=1 Tax=Catellatospora sichuanensis TaxID=1969805 RepID=UPI0011836761|nr:Lsr2 family protein [Catellatospora sichuanensis]
MARETIVLYKDDLNGDEGAKTIKFGLDGVAYEIDLGEKNEAKLRKVLAEFVGVATRIGRYHTGSAGGKSTAEPVGDKRSKEQQQAIRDWAKQQGYSVSDRGRIAGDVVAAFDAAHK